MSKTLCFSITGEFVTNTARAWFWAELKPFKTVERFLLDCMSGTDTPIDTLKQFVREVLLGKKKFIGNTADGSYALTDDNTNIKREYHYMRYMRLSKDIEYIYEKVKAGDLDVDIDEYEYGWLNTRGEFFPVPFGGHERFAGEYVEKAALFDRRYERGTSGLKFRSSGDFLVKGLGWVLIDNPEQGSGIITRDHSRRLTKAQKEFLYDYLHARGRYAEANAIYEED